MPYKIIDKLKLSDRLRDCSKDEFVMLFKKVAGIDELARREEGYREVFRVYQMSAHWQRLRVEVIKIQSGICKDCSGKIDDIHHLTYKTIGNESVNALVGVCRSCHMKRHRIKPTLDIGLSHLSEILNVVI